MNVNSNRNDFEEDTNDRSSSAGSEMNVGTEQSDNDNNTDAIIAAQEEEARLDLEIEIVQKMRQAFASSLVMLEAARDDLVGLGERMDRLQRVSQACRETLLERERQQRQQQQEDTRKRAASR